MKETDKGKTDLAIKALELGQVHLTKLENEVLIAVFYDNLTFAQIGVKRQLTRGRIKQIYTNALRRILKGLDETDQLIKQIHKLLERNAALEKMLVTYIESEIDSAKEHLLKNMPEATQVILRERIENTELSNRAKNSLSFGGIETVLQLVDLDLKGLLSIRNMGKRTAEEIQSFMQKNNLYWRMFYT